MGSWTTMSLGVGCHVILAYTIHFGQCVPIIIMNWDEHGGKTSGHTWD
jgi:hypothetical protein